MKELIQRLCNIPDAYDDFILGVISYAKKNPAHVELLNNYMKNSSKSLISCDIIEFIASQPDFYSYSATKKVQQVC